MNDLSLFLYAADVADKLGFFIGAAFVISAIIAAVTLVAVPFSEGGVLEERNRPKWWKILKTSVIVCCVSFLLGAVVPSKNTMYAIAASEMGERVVTSPTGEKAVKAIEAWLDRQIATKETAK